MSNLELRDPTPQAEQVATPSTTEQPSSSLTPHAQRLASERVIINAPMSFAGAAQRSWRIVEGNSKALIPGVVLVIALWWTAIVLWYLTFGLFLVPYRLLRRGARKRKAEALRHRELLETVKR
jgi:hypothetical protein